MRRRKLLWQLYPSYLLITLSCVVAATLYASMSLRNFFLEQLAAELEVRAHLIRRQVLGSTAPDNTDHINALCKELGRDSSTRITIITTSGQVIGDSEEEPAKMDNHADRPEVKNAMLGKTVPFIRHSHTLGGDMMYIAIPIKEQGKIIGVVRTSVAVTWIDHLLNVVYTRIVLAGIVIALLAAAISFAVSRRISRPLEEIRHGAKQLSEGNLTHRLSAYDSEEIGSLAETINDMASRLHRLEIIRRDFVANVSHELRTPITTIKGFVETLLDGSMERESDARRFLTIIAKQVDNLNAIIEDLLNLSRIEQESEREEIALEEHHLHKVLESAIQVCEPQAGQKKIKIQTGCDWNLTAMMNSRLIEQMIVNLVDNAIKYSEPETVVTVEARESDSEILIWVQDQGCGIDEKHLPRLFERFYRVDKARSRKLGGTGLGLAIVKHIAQDHGGSVTVESEPGKGSTFTVHLPKSREKGISND